jgi:DHA2 family methylenomycin A resistance protein-like MFS transporter
VTGSARKKVFVAGLAIFTIASMACALAPTLDVLIGARTVQGIGAAVLVPNSLTLLNHAYDDEKSQRRAVGLWAAGGSLALTASPILGGLLVAAFGWRSVFLVNLPIGGVGLAPTWSQANETPVASDRPVDLPGQAIAVFCLSSLSATLIHGGEAGWNSDWIWSGFAVSLFAPGVHRAANDVPHNRCCRCHFAMIVNSVSCRARGWLLIPPFTG